MQIIQGERISRTGRLATGCSGALFDPQGRLLLTRRTDNGRWCQPGGSVDPGESVSECCAREFLEETGLVVRVDRLIGVYSNVDLLVTYADGNRWHLISLHFAVTWLAGEPGLSNETTEWGFFTRAEIATMDVIETHIPRIADSWDARPETLLR